MLSKAFEFEELLCIGDPNEVLSEVNNIVLLMFPQFDFILVQHVFKDIVKLFHGKYPGYRRCNTLYHDLTHTMDCLLATARLIYGAFINGIIFEEKNVALGLISALLHDTGYIQSAKDHIGTGGKYTLVHINRSIEFMRKYFLKDGFSVEGYQFCRNCLKCTGLDRKINEIRFQSRDNEMLGKILGAADLLGQMADRHYLEKLPALYNEFKEGGVLEFDDEIDLLRKTPDFWEACKKRFLLELDHVDRYLLDHFRVRWGIGRHLYHEAIERNMEFLKFILKCHETDYRQYLGHKISLRPARLQEEETICKNNFLKFVSIEKYSLPKFKESITG